MLLTMHSTLGSPVMALDGKNGRVEDFLIDDQTWSLRFLIAEIGGWFQHSRVLIPTLLVGPSTDKGGGILVELRGADMGHCFRAIDTEIWAGRYHLLFEPLTCEKCFGSLMPPAATPPAQAIDLRKITVDAADSSSLRSIREMLGFDVVGIDGTTIGAVDDFQFDMVSWRVRKLVMRRGMAPFSRWATISPGCLEGVSWVRRSIRFDGTRDSLPWSDANRRVSA